MGWVGAAFKIRVHNRLSIVTTCISFLRKGSILRYFGVHLPIAWCHLLVLVSISDVSEHSLHKVLSLLDERAFIEGHTPLVKRL